MFIRLFIALTLTAAAFAQDAERLTHDIATDAKPWTSDTPKMGAKDFHFVIVSDNSGRPRPGIYREAMEKANLLQPAFVMSVGDMIDGRTGEDESTYEKIDEQWEEFMTYLEPLSMPFVFVPGNHDVPKKDARHQYWTDRFGPMHYHFLYRDVLFIVNDSTNYSEDKVAWVGEVLDAHPDVRWTFYIQHHPHWLTDPLKWGPLWNHLEKRERLTILGGHIHTYIQSERGNIQHITLGTTGGSSQLRGVHYGEFDHLLWVSVTDEGPVFANVALEGILPTDYRSMDLALAFRPFTDNRVVTSEVVTLDGDTFEAAEWIVRVENPWDKPMRLKGLLEAREGVLPNPSGFNLLVPPNEAVEQRIAVHADSPIPLNEWQPIALHWHAAYDADNAAPIQFSDVMRLHWDGIHTSARKSIEVDGDLGEWGALAYKVTQPGDILDNEATWRGVHDGTFSFAVAHDDDYIYMAIRTTDDQLETDGIGVLQDFGRAVFRALGDNPREVDPDPDHIISVVDGISITDRERARHEEYRKLKQSAGSEMGALYASRQIENGFEYEFAVPRAKLEEVSGRSTQYVQVNAGINDHDDADARLGMSLMMWRPHWAYAANDQTALGIFHLPD